MGVSPSARCACSLERPPEKNFGSRNCRWPAELEKHESQLVELRVCSRELTAKYNAKVEHQECLIRAEAFFKAGALFEPSNPILNIVEPPEDGLQPLLVNDISGAYSSAAYAD